MNTDEIRRAIREDKPEPNWIWLRCRLTEALNEIDRLEKEPLLSDNEFNEVQIKREVEQRIKEACKEKLKGKAIELHENDSWVGPSIALDVALQVIDSVGGIE